MNKQIYQKWWFWVIIFFLCMSFYGMSLEDKQNEIVNETTETIILTGEQLGEYGREVILNKDTDMPVTKYLYKVPAGTYKVTTNNDKVSSFYVVKDEITIDEENTEYPETLNYVSPGYLLTNSDTGYEKIATKDVTITLNEDESIQIVDKDTIILEKIK